jgi:hypothetical protein
VILCAAVIATVWFAALAWGSNTPWAIAIISTFALLTMAGQAVFGALRGSLRLQWNRTFVPLILLLGFAGLQYFRPVRGLELDSILPHTVEG